MLFTWLAAVATVAMAVASSPVEAVVVPHVAVAVVVWLMLAVHSAALSVLIHVCFSSVSTSRLSRELANCYRITITGSWGRLLFLR